jgi:hypothetical protein
MIETKIITRVAVGATTGGAFGLELLFVFFSRSAKEGDCCLIFLYENRKISVGITAKTKFENFRIIKKLSLSGMRDSRICG